MPQHTLQELRTELWCGYIHADCTLPHSQVAVLSCYNEQTALSNGNSDRSDVKEIKQPS